MSLKRTNLCLGRTEGNEKGNEKANEEELCMWLMPMDGMKAANEATGRLFLTKLVLIKGFVRGCLIVLNMERRCVSLSRLQRHSGDLVQTSRAGTRYWKL